MGLIHRWKVHLGVTASAVAFLLSGGAALGVDSPTRTEYVDGVERICKEGLQGHGGILKGIDEMVRDGRLKAVGRRFHRSAGALLGVIRRIDRVEPPEADRDRIRTWLGHGRKGARFLERISRELKAGRRAAAEAKADRLLAEIRRANATVIGFGFEDCRLQPARFV
jgi:hypothetical protein